MNSDPKIGDQFQVGRITAEYRGGRGPLTWLAFLDGDRRKWDVGPTMAAAIGRLVMSHQVSIFPPRRIESSPHDQVDPDSLTPAPAV